MKTKALLVVPILLLACIFADANCQASTNTNPSAQRHHELGKDFLENQNFDMAIKEFNEALRIAPTSEALVDRGTAYNGLSKYDLAIKDFDQAIKLSPNSYLGFNNRGVTHWRRAEYAQALSDFDRAIAIDGKQAIAYLNRAGAALCNNDGKNAAQRISNWLKLTGWKDVYAGHAAVLASLGYRQGKDEQAANKILSEALLKVDKLKWPYPAIRYFHRDLKGKEMMEEAENSDYATTQANCFLALDMLQKNRAKDAQAHLEWTVKHGTRNSVEYWIAKGFYKPTQK